MTGSKSYRREDKNRRSNSNSNSKLFSIGDKAKSFHGRSGGPITETLARPMTVPDLLHVSGFTPGMAVTEEVRVHARPTKVLLNVTVQRSLGAVQVLMAP